MTRLLIIAVIVAAAIIAVRRPVSAPPPLAAVATPLFRGVPAQRNANRNALVVYVVGAVRRAGLYRLRDGSRVDDVVRLAGGFTAGADPAATNLARRLRDGDEITVARIGDASVARTRKSSSKTAGRKRKTASLEPASVDINHADVTAIAALPSVGPALAQRIVAFRELNGPFVSLDDLGDIAGMTAARIDAVAPYVVLR